MECLKYLHEHGCVWDESACEAAALGGHSECLKYLHTHGCPGRGLKLSVRVKRRLEVTSWSV